MATIIETLQGSAADGKAFVAEAKKLLAAAGLTLPDAKGSTKELLLTRIAAQRPETTWLEVGERAGDGVEKHVATGRWTTAVTLFYDRPRLAVIEHHVRGVEGDHDHQAWAEVKRFADAAKADVLWARYAKKYKLGTTAAAAAPTAKLKVSTAVAGEAALMKQWFEKQDDATLSVLADVWMEAGDPRGEFVRLSLAGQPTDALRKKHGGKLVGPARPFLRDWEFGPNGIVNNASTEVANVIQGIDAIARIHPRLCLTITSLKTQKIAAELAKVSLAPLYYAGTAMGLGGGGCMLNDKVLVAAAPAWRGVKRWSLSARGVLPTNFTPAGLAGFLDQLAPGVEYVLFDHWTNPDEANSIPPLKAYTDVIRKHPNTRAAQLATDFHKLRGDLGLTS